MAEPEAAGTIRRGACRRCKRAGRLYAWRTPMRCRVPNRPIECGVCARCWDYLAETFGREEQVPCDGR